MTHLKSPLLRIVMVSVLRNLTRIITSLKAIGNPSMSLENFSTRNHRSLIGNLASLKEKILKPRRKLFSITKKPHVLNVEEKATPRTSVE